MAKVEQMLRLRYIEEFLRSRKKGASYRDIERYLEYKFAEAGRELKFTERTFQRDKENICDLFKISIEYNRKRNVYHIAEDKEDDAHDVFDNLLLVEAYKQADCNKNIMLFERRKARGLENLNGIIHAITHRKVLSFQYEKFDSNEVNYRAVEPYVLKEFRHRWYLIGKEHKPQNGNTMMKTFGLDRITDLDIKNTSFQRDDYYPDKVFEHSFGIISSEEEPQKILISCDWQQGQYIKSMPFHHSQIVEKEDKSKNEVVISLFLKPTYDFEREILSYGSGMKVLAPESFKKRLKEEVSNMYTKYKK